MVGSLPHVNEHTTRLCRRTVASATARWHSFISVWRVEDDTQAIATNLTNFLRTNLKPGQNADVAINPELRHVLVFVDGELTLTCSFDDLLLGPGTNN